MWMRDECRQGREGSGQHWVPTVRGWGLEREKAAWEPGPESPRGAEPGCWAELRVAELQRLDWKCPRGLRSH